MIEERQRTDFTASIDSTVPDFMHREGGGEGETNVAKNSKNSTHFSLTSSNANELYIVY